MYSCLDCTVGRNKKYVVPVRFMCACENGHIDDFPWRQYAQHQPKCSQKSDLKLIADGKSSGLSGLKLICTECHTEVGMQSAFVQEQFNFPCRGRRPWINKDDEKCTAKLRAVQRGASNLYFPVIKSALDIPPWCDNFVRSFGTNWSKFANEKDDSKIMIGLEFHDIQDRLGISKDEILKKIKKLQVKAKGSTQETILMEEYEQFISNHTGIEPHEDFETVSEVVPIELSKWISKVIGVKRLREVRVLTGFTRIFASGDEQEADRERIAPIYNERQNWLPAVDVRGEGIFIEINHKTLRNWESNNKIKDRASSLQTRYDKEVFERSGGSIEKGSQNITPKMLLIHSLSHALIKQLSLMCGYSSASLRERLYFDDDMAGILIYTASSDSDGTLGGLVRQANEDNFYKLFMRALRDMLWCSSDPICANSLEAVSDTLNNSACHNCLFLSETSCTHFNRFLDRCMIVGVPEDPSTSFFSGLRID
jgi:hypothetical protein